MVSHLPILQTNKPPLLAVCSVSIALRSHRSKRLNRLQRCEALKQPFQSDLVEDHSQLASLDLNDDAAYSMS